MADLLVVRHEHDAVNEQRILKVMPDYQTVRDSSIPLAPLTPRQKWDLAWKEIVDPFNFASVATAARISQRGNQTPRYGEGGRAYGDRVGAAFADFGTQDFFSAGVLANLLHQDPRYYRKGPGTGVLKRAAYSASRIAVVRTDSGRSSLEESSACHRRKARPGDPRTRASAPQFMLVFGDGKNEWHWVGNPPGSLVNRPASAG